jgi:hypothetical protein
MLVLNHTRPCNIQISIVNYGIALIIFNVFNPRFELERPILKLTESKVEILVNLACENYVRCPLVPLFPILQVIDADFNIDSFQPPSGTP